MEFVPKHHYSQRIVCWTVGLKSEGECIIFQMVGMFFTNFLFAKTVPRGLRVGELGNHGEGNRERARCEFS